MATAHSLPVHEWTNVEDALAAHDLAADHPVEGASVAQLVRTFGHHARAVHVLARESALSALLKLLPDPILEILDGVAADAKLDEMQSHDRYSRAKADGMIAGRAGLSMHAPCLSSEDGLDYCGGASGVGAERAGAALGG